MSAARAKKKYTKKSKSSVPSITSEALAKHLRAALESENPLLALRSEQKILSPLVLIGEEQLRIQRLITWIRERLFPSLDKQQTYFGDELTSKHSVTRISAALQNLSLFSSEELIVIYNADKVRVAAADPLAEALTRTSESTLVILTASAYNQRQGLFSRLKNVPHTIVDIKALEGNKLLRWIEKEAARVDVNMSQDATAMLAKCYGNDINRLSQEVEKLALLVDTKGQITRSLVEQTSLQTPEMTSFELFQCIARKDTVRAVTLAHTLIHQGFHPLQLSSFLSRCSRILLAQKEKQGIKLHAELSNYWFTKNLGSAANHYKSEDLVTSIDVLKNLDMSLKGANTSPELVTTIAVQRLANRTPATRA
jgi:DNA polymerase-3 subunit delta